MEAYTPNLTQVLSSSAASGTVAALSPGGALMQGGTQQAINQMVPNDIQSELKHLYVAVGELLRHFWSCFPVNTPFLEEKVVKMKSNLERFQVTKLCPFQEKIRRQYLSTNLVSHIEEMLQTAYNKLHTWQSRRLMKKTWGVPGAHRFCEIEKTVTCSDSGTGLTDMQMLTKQETSAACPPPELTHCTCTLGTERKEGRTVAQLNPGEVT